jgi:hypothetical protein
MMMMFTKTKADDDDALLDVVYISHVEDRFSKTPRLQFITNEGR